MNRMPAQRGSLRVWLQSTCLLAVVAGYSLLLLINQRMADWQRLEGFQKASAQALSSLSRRAGSVLALERLLREEAMVGLDLTLVMAGSAEDSDPFASLGDQGRQWIVQTVPMDLQDGSRVLVQIRQDVSDSVQQERLAFWLLVASAGVSSLVTSALLRPILKQGLVAPLQTFGDQLQAIQMPPSPGEALTVEEQPQELRPIAIAFNGMQHRLWTSWEQQRIFTDGVAHELRTPITLVSGYAQSLLRLDIPEELIPTLQLIRNEADRMKTLIRDLLDIARQDSDRLNLQSEIIHADEALVELYERMRTKANGRLLLDAFSEDTPEPPCAIGDHDRIQQCLTALVDNALCYSDEETIVILKRSASETGGLVLHVCDEGPGVACNEKELIFERFFRGSAALNTNIRGSGVGLAVVKLLMEAMGGSVKVFDTSSGGADFQLHLKSSKSEIDSNG